MQELKEKALTILNAGLSALKPEKILTKKVLEKTGVLEWDKFYIIGFGKGIRFYAQILEDLLGDKLKGGMVNDIEKMPLKKIIVNQAAHPLPDKSSLSSTQKILQFIREIPQDAAILCLVAGGGSSLFTWPTFAVRRLGTFSDLLIKCGADIKEMNVVRKHLDRVKGGGLAQMFYPRSCVSLIISDVPGDDLDTIASGPTVFDASTKEEAEKIIDKYQLPKKIEGSSVDLIETPKDEKLFKNVQNVLIATNKTAIDAMAKKARTFDFRPKILNYAQKGDSESVGQMLFREVKKVIEVRKSDKSEKGEKGNKVALIAGGETTVKVAGKGKGGRNTHLCLAALKFLPINTVLLAVDSDGQDNSDAAGAIISEETLKKAKELGLAPDDYLANFDSYHFFQKTGDLIKTGPLPTNVGDLMLVLRES